MKNYTFLFSLLWLGLSFTSFKASGNASPNAWKIIDQQQVNGITAKLKLRQTPSLNSRHWISLEFENNTSKSLMIENAYYTIDCKLFDKKGGKLIKQGKIASRSAAELLDKSLDSPIPMIELSPGNNVSSSYPSIVGALLLSVPERENSYVEATLQLHLQLGGNQQFSIDWEALPFAFDWARPQPLEFSALYQQLNDLLDHPVYSTLHHYELLALLSVPEISKGINAKTLVDALRKRSGREDGKIAILYHLNDHFSDDPAVVNYYTELLKTKQASALEELSLAPDIWSDQFLEPLLAQYQDTNIGQMHQIMNLMYLHQDSWIKSDGISNILTDLILYQFEHIIYESPTTLDKYQLRTAALLIEMLGKSGNKEIIPIICPFLEEEERISDSGLVLDPASLELPRPMRVCDHALESLLRLQKMDLIRVYKKNKYKPPYENGESEIIISRIRDNLIKELKKKGKVCKG